MNFILTLKIATLVISLLSGLIAMRYGFLLYKKGLEKNKGMPKKFIISIIIFVLFAAATVFLMMKYPNLGSRVVEDQAAAKKEHKEPSYEAGGAIVELKGKSLFEIGIEIKNANPGISAEELDEKMESEKGPIEKEQADFIKEVLALSPEIKVEKQYMKALNAIYLQNVPESVFEELKKRGYNVDRNVNIEWQGFSNCPVKITDYLDMTGVKNATSAKGLGVDGAGINIGIIDSGAEESVLPKNFSGGADYCNHNKCSNSFGGACKASDPPWCCTSFPGDYIGHGTHVSSILMGMAPGADYFMYRSGNNMADAIKVLNDKVGGSGSDHLNVINMSFSINEESPEPNSKFVKAINNAVDLYDVVIVAAAGNEDQGQGTCDWTTYDGYNDTCYNYVVASPAAATKVIAVAASDKSNNLSEVISLGGPASYRQGPSDSAATFMKPDLVAPGQNICAGSTQLLEDNFCQKGCTNGFCKDTYGNKAWNDGESGFFGWCKPGEAVLSGTSMASPVVSGAAALLRQAHHGWNADEIKSALRMTANDGAGNLASKGVFERGMGLVDVEKAIGIKGRPPIARFVAMEYEHDGGSAFSVSGTASDLDNFDRYEVSYGEGRNPESFTSIKTFSDQVAGGKLFTFNPLPSCTIGKEFLFKLDVYDKSDNVATDYMLIKVR